MFRGGEMMSNIILVAESGSDVPQEIAEKQGIYIVPMYVSFDTVSKPDSSLLPEEICEFYKRTGIIPKTSCSTPGDFIRVFDEIHGKFSDGKILYLAYSAVTTCTYQNAVLAAEDRDYVTCLDTKTASAGQGAIVLRMSYLLQEHPEWEMENAVDAAMRLIEKSHMCFIPSNMDFLRAGGRCSNVTALCGNVLGIHPLIEMVDGKPKATRKYRGRMERIIPRVISDYEESKCLQKEEVWLMYSHGLSKECIRIAEQVAQKCGFQRIHWIRTGGVITCHGGPGAFGISGFSK